MPAGLVVTHGRAHGARMAAQPAEAVGARCKPPGQIPWPGGCECGGGDTMNALAANDFEAADLLALARLDDGAPGRCGPAMAPAWPPRTGREGMTQTLVPRGSGRAARAAAMAGRGGSRRGPAVAPEVSAGR